MRKITLILVLILATPAFPRDTTVSVVSGSTNRLESAMMYWNGSTMSILYQTGPWLDSVTRTATGKYTLAITSGVFSIDPSCVCTTQSGSAKECSADNNVVLSETQWAVLTASAGTLADSSFHIMCMGPTE